MCVCVSVRTRFCGSCLELDFQRGVLGDRFGVSGVCLPNWKLGARWAVRMAESQELFCSKEARLRPSDSAQVPGALPMEETSVTWSLLPLQNPMAVATHRNLVQVSAVP